MPGSKVTATLSKSTHTKIAKNFHLKILLCDKLANTNANSHPIFCCNFTIYFFSVKRNFWTLLGLLGGRTQSLSIFAIFRELTWKMLTSAKMKGYLGDKLNIFWKILYGPYNILKDISQSYVVAEKIDGGHMAPLMVNRLN